jgi:hypothetical protein
LLARETAGLVCFSTKFDVVIRAIDEPGSETETGDGVFAALLSLAFHAVGSEERTLKGDKRALVEDGDGGTPKYAVRKLGGMLPFPEHAIFLDCSAVDIQG